ncbi:hypothetical protein LTS07_005220 [Exophiala sideris]|uniref:F-box domain-containing protein n=1 Tax=Exophiala sideris TaxID=1016849 RepID=A0ABR0JBH7_9EURO|nr:hypothetical protein LTS07_005220 [Exophiala sideris]KAK5038489.1 hypothetical protein LTR13_004236 [Exophiala sideris]KAK5060372.1 hypothetical protein LTR69_005689 [Exophiala sideris]KAK5183282.1 hypothetical protein LTR44_004283 [Eurotiomycetes sp. CCFEE 6388]
MAECRQELGNFPINSLPLEVIELIGAASNPATLVQWSSTCRFYRDLLSPHVFRYITFGPKLPPSRVVEALSRNVCIKSLTFTCEADRHSRQAKEDSEARNDEGQRPSKDSINFDLLGQVLRRLPTNLANLTLRFPHEWTAVDNMCWPEQFAFEDEQPLTACERHDLHHEMLWTTLDSMAKNNISHKQEFQLQIHNMSPHVSGVYHQPSFRNFLRQVTSFTLALCKFNRHPSHRPLERTWYRYLLSGWFYDQLHRVETFTLSAKPIWLNTAVVSLGVQLYSTLSPKPDHLPNLKHLTLSGLFIDPDLIAFLTSHAQNIQSVSLHNCFCHATTKDGGTSWWLVDYDVSQCPPWSSLFDSLAAQKSAKLTSFTISYDSWHIEDRMPCYYEERHDTEACAGYSPHRFGSLRQPLLCKSLMAAAVLDAECRRSSRLTGIPCEKHSHQSLMFLYSDLHVERHGKGASAYFLWGTTDTCMSFIEGSDFESWMSASMNLTNVGIWRSRVLFSSMVGRKATEKVLVPPDSPLAAPALQDQSLCFSYEIARGEMGVLSFEPYKGLILPYWAFRTVPIAEKSADILWTIFESYVERGDLVGADMTRKFIQMGMTRARRYANHKGGRKYGEDGKQLEKWTDDDVDGKRKEKEEASEVFKAYWRRCIASKAYVQLKKDWSTAKKKYLDAQG